MSNTYDTDTSTLSDEEREILAFWMKQERQEKLLLQQIKPRQSTDSPPLSFAQQRLWVVEQMADTGAAYNLTMGLRISGPLRIDVLEKSLGEILRRHEVLRSSIDLKDGEPIQLIHPPAPVQVEFTDLSEVNSEQAKIGVRKFYAEAGATVFDLARGPLMRSHLLRLKQQEHILVICMHHIVTDGWSFNLLQREFLVLYEAYLSGNSSSLTELPVQYADYAIWQRNWLAGDEYKRQLDYWCDQLKDLTTLELPTDRIRPALPSFKGGMAGIKLETELKHSLVKLAQQEDVTLFILLLAVFTLLLHKYCGQDDIVIGSPVANRSRIETEALIGFFVNMLVLRTDLSGNPGFRELLARVRDTAFEAYEHQDLPIERMVDELKIVRDMSRNPLFQVSFALQEKGGEAKQQVGDLSLSSVAAGNPTARFDLEFYLMEGKQDLDILAVYNTDLFDAATIERMLSHYRCLLAGIAANPDLRLGELQMLSAQERQQQLVDWNQTGVEYPRDKTVGKMFEVQAATNPDAVAVGYRDSSLGYAQLNTNANRLAHYLIEQGVSANIPVVVLMPRCADLIVAQLAVLKAGGAYVPIDPDYPTQRLAFVLEDTAAPVLLTHSSLLEKVSGYSGQSLCVDSEAQQLERYGPENPDVPIQAEDLAYIIYTSGSTGEPKGVEVVHRGLTNLVSWHCRTYQITPLDRATHLAGLGFDATVWELWPYLCAGASIHLVPDDLRLEHASLWAWMASHGITLSFMPTPMAEAALLEPLPVDLVLRVLLTGGDRLHGGLLRHKLPFSLVNHYGPSENSVVATCAEVDLNDAREPPIGRPIDNVRSYILDQYRQPVAVGVSGELYIGGEGLARGYLNQAEMTAEKFVPDPFTSEANSRLYRTGDIARYRPDGSIGFIGRIDRQVQLRGFRIELGEIEAVLNRQAGIDSAVAVLHEVEAGDSRLVAYLVAESGLVAPVAEMRELLRIHLPEYMLPSAFVMLDKLPLTSNGKVDRRALPAPQDLGDSFADEYAPPRSELEQQLAQIWVEVLKLERLGVHDNFFDLGGHSLMATQVVSRIRENLDIELPLSDLFAHPTIAELAPLVELLRSAHDAGELQRIEPVARGEALPLSFPQQRLWYLDQLEPESLAYNIPSAIKLTGNLDIEALRGSLQEIINRHEVLRTTFSVRDGQALQDIKASFALELPLEDLSAVNEAERSAVLRQCLNEDALQPFNLATGPMMRNRLLRLDESQHVLIFTIHHIVTDGWSFGILFRELGALYTAFCHRRPNPLPDLQIQYADFAAWQRQWLSGDVLQAQLDYWTNQLEGIGNLNLPTDRPRPAIQTFSGAHTSLMLDKELSAQLQEINRQQAATSFMTLLSAFSVLLGRYCNQQEIVVGTPVANRNHREIEDLIGFFVNTLVIRTDVSDDQTFYELLNRVKQITIEALQHQDLPFEALVDALQPERDRSRNPLFQVLFVVQNTPAQNLLLEGLTLESMPFDAESTRFDLEFHIWQGVENLHLNIAYNTDLFAADTIERMLRHYRSLLESVVADPDQAIDSLAMQSEAEKDLLLSQWNQTDQDYPQGLTLQQLFEAQVARSPEAVALEYDEQRLSYAELDALANRLAHRLQAEGVGPGQLVGVHMLRSLEMLIALCAVLKAGGAYVPLDPDYPQDRIAYMAAEAQLRVLLTQPDLQADLPGVEAMVICVDHAALSAEAPVASISSAASADDLAYVIYTSGSTGKPKGVMNCHSGIVNRLQWMQQAYSLSAQDRVLQKTPYSFDVSVWEFFWPLISGARLVIARPEGHKDPVYLSRLIRDRQISTLHFVPSMLQVFLDNSEAGDFTSVKRVICSGEALPYVLQQQFFSLHQAELLNLYGPTEAAVEVSYWACRADDDRQLVPIGRPVANTRLYILDRCLRPVPIGVSGELYIGGVQVARGYLGQPELTAEKFIADPFSVGAGSRLYRTGDLARYLSDGAIEYLGRIDNQIKLRGLRIELGEIEVELGSHEAVREVVVVAREDDPGNERLVAYVVKRQDADADAELLRQHLRGILPDYMLPSAFVFLETLPLTPSGKVDRKALPRPQVQKRVREPKNKPQTEMEILLAEIWEELLEIEDIETDEMFFDLGGHSLLTIKVIDRFAEQTNLRIPVASFMSQTLRQIAASAETSLMAAEKGSAKDPDKGSGRSFLGLFKK